MSPLARRRAVTAIALLVAVVAVAWLAPRLTGRHFLGTTYDEVGPAPDFQLVDHTGAPRTLRSYRGEVVLLFFGFTHCPDVCPTTLQRLAAASRSLGADSASVRILLVTVDPARDTPEALGAYVRRFTPRAVGLSGDSARLSAAQRGYGAYVLPVAGGHGMTHSMVVYGIDRGGVLRVVIPGGAPVDDVAHDVRELVRL